MSIDQTESPPERPGWSPIRFPTLLIEEARELIPHLRHHAEFRAMGRVTPSLVLRMAAIEGFRVLRERYVPKEEPSD